MFFVSAGIYLFGWLIYVICANAEEQDWAKGNPEEALLSNQTHQTYGLTEDKQTLLSDSDCETTDGVYQTTSPAKSMDS